MTIFSDFLDNFWPKARKTRSLGHEFDCFARNCQKCQKSVIFEGPKEVKKVSFLRSQMLETLLLLAEIGSKSGQKWVIFGPKSGHFRTISGKI